MFSEERNVKTILVIEDEKEIRSDIVKTLQLNNFETLAAPDGEVGYEMAKKHLPDLIVSDIMMPGLDGFELLKELQKLPDTENIPFLFLSAKSDKSDVREGMNLGADDFITKPYDIDELLTAVEARMKRKEAFKSAYVKRFEELKKNINKTLPHEVRTPLSLILGYSDFLRKTYEKTPPEEAKDILMEINEAGQRLHRLFDNNLLYANLETFLEDDAETDQRRKNVTNTVESIIRDIASYLSQKAGRKNDLFLDIEDAEVRVTEELFVKIIEELIDNAIKFSEKGTRIEVKSYSMKKFYRLSFRDSGRGMTEEQIHNYGAYMQFERNIYEQQGVGMGLAIVSKIAQLHNGKIHIESKPEKYTKVSVDLPLYFKPDDEE